MRRTLRHASIHRHHLVPSRRHRCAIRSYSNHPDILQCESCDLYPFGEPTSDPSRALFRDLTWRIQDEKLSSTGDSNGNKKGCEAWAVIGPGAIRLVDAALLGRARAEPPQSRRWPIIPTSTPIESVIKKVSFNTRLKSKSPFATVGEFTDYTARYFSIRADDEAALTLRGHLESYLRTEANGLASSSENVFLLETAKALKLDHLLDIPLVALSNGQTRRARIARALLAHPEVLILEEPFTGLDQASRALIADLLGDMHHRRSPRVVLVLRPQDSVPPWINRIAAFSTSHQYQPNYIGDKEGYTPDHARAVSQDCKRRVSVPGAQSIVVLKKGNISYKNRHVLKNVDWHIKQGDRITLTGANGSGKSTLLSLVLGDHPASYSQDLTLFGQARTHHSTYSLGQRTGHFSPELYSAFPKRHGDAGISLFEAIGTGFDNVFTYRRLSEEQKSQVNTIVTAFDPTAEMLPSTVLHGTLFAKATPAIQAVVLILRAMVKIPQLLILDEPFAGMDEGLVQKCRVFLDSVLTDNQALVFISHYPEEWPMSIGKRLHLEDGQAVETLL